MSLQLTNQRKNKIVLAALQDFIEEHPTEIVPMTMEFGYLSTHTIRNWFFRKRIAHRELEKVERYLKKKGQVVA